VRCRKARWFLSARCDGTLSERQRARLDDHLNQCPSCRREAFYFSEIGALANKLEPVAVRPDFNLRLRAAIQRKENAEVVRRNWYHLNLTPGWRTAIAAASVLALFAVTYGGYRVFSSGSGDSQPVAPAFSVDQDWTTSSASGQFVSDPGVPDVPSGWTPVSGLSPDAQRLRDRYLAARQGPSEYILETVRLDDLNLQQAEPRYVMPIVRSDQVAQKVSY
jgi:hypothetical protein